METELNTRGLYATPFKAKFHVGGVSSPWMFKISADNMRKLLDAYKAVKD